MRLKTEAARCQAGRNLYVDRLRGLASLSVVLSHASGYGFINIMLYMVPRHVLVSIAANAYHGVTLFFVISGFLITTKILNDSDGSGRFSLSSFYRDRVARIAPCLILMLTAACGLAAIGIPAFHVDWSEIPSALWAVFTFHYNVWKPTQAMPRLWDPLWSLSIEEVFYLVFPAFLLLLRKRVLLVCRSRCSASRRSLFTAPWRGTYMTTSPTSISLQSASSQRFSPGGRVLVLV